MEAPSYATLAATLSCFNAHLVPFLALYTLAGLQFCLGAVVLSARHITQL